MYSNYYHHGNKNCHKKHHTPHTTFNSYAIQPIYPHTTFSSYAIHLIYPRTTFSPHAILESRQSFHRFRKENGERLCLGNEHDGFKKGQEY